MAARIAYDLSSGGDGAALFRLSSRLKAVRAEDVSRAAKRWLIESPSAWIALGDPSLLSGLSPAAFVPRGSAPSKP
jgi:predicted Zn-dependent peptidase